MRIKVSKDLILKYYQIDCMLDFLDKLYFKVILLSQFSHRNFLEWRLLEQRGTQQHPSQQPKEHKAPHINQLRRSGSWISVR